MMVLPAEPPCYDKKPELSRVVSIPIGFIRNEKTAKGTSTTQVPGDIIGTGESAVLGRSVRNTNNTVHRPLGTDSTAIKSSNDAVHLSSSNISKQEMAVSGRWTHAEHTAFLSGLKLYGRAWKRVAESIPTRTTAQVRSHAQKYLNKVSIENQETLTFEARHNPTRSVPLDSEAPAKATTSSSSYIGVVKEILSNPATIETRINVALHSLRERCKTLENDLSQIKEKEATMLPLGPASAALKLEQSRIRKAAEARHEMKRRPHTAHRDQSRNWSSAHVSTPLMPSREFLDVVFPSDKLGSDSNRNDCCASKKQKTDD